MGCCSSKRSHVLPSISLDPSLPQSQFSRHKSLSRKANSFPWLVKALTTPRLNISESSLYLRRKMTNKESGLDTSESLYKFSRARSHFLGGLVGLGSAV